MSSDLKELIERSLFDPSNEERSFSSEFERVHKHHIDSLVLFAPETDKAIVFFHGNYGNVTWYTEKMKMIQKKNPTCDIWCFDYPGFGKSKGNSNTDKLIDSAYTFLNMISKMYKSWEWVCETIGAGVAMGVLVQGDKKLDYLPSKITIINGFRSVGNMAMERSSIPNAKHIVKKFGFELNTYKWIIKARETFNGTCPSFCIIRALDDKEIPMKHSQDLCEAAGVSLVVVNGTHRDYEI